MIPQISGGAGRAPAKKIEAAFGISLASLRSRFPLKIADGLLLSSGGTGPLGGIHLGLQHPAAQRLRADPDLRADRLAGGIQRRYSSR
jgi:hypothetical protein